MKRVSKTKKPRFVVAQLHWSDDAEKILTIPSGAQRPKYFKVKIAIATGLITISAKVCVGIVRFETESQFDGGENAALAFKNRPKEFISVLAEAS